MSILIIINDAPCNMIELAEWVKDSDKIITF